MSETYHTFKINGKVELLTLADAIRLKHPEVNLRVQEIIQNYKNKRMTKDGFEPGWQENIRENISSRGEYDRRIKELGLVEIGYDYAPKDSTTEGNYNREEFIKTAKEVGVELTGNEIEAIKTGEYFDESKCDSTMDKDYQSDLI